MSKFNADYRTMSFGPVDNGIKNQQIDYSKHLRDLSKDPNTILLNPAVANSGGEVETIHFGTSSTVDTSGLSDPSVKEKIVSEYGEDFYEKIQYQKELYNKVSITAGYLYLDETVIAELMDFKKQPINLEEVDKSATDEYDYSFEGAMPECDFNSPEYIEYVDIKYGELDDQQTALEEWIKPFEELLESTGCYNVDDYGSVSAALVAMNHYYSNDDMWLSGNGDINISQFIKCLMDHNIDPEEFFGMSKTEIIRCEQGQLWKYVNAGFQKCAADIERIESMIAALEKDKNEIWFRAITQCEDYKYFKENIYRVFPEEIDFDDPYNPDNIPIIDECLKNGILTRDQVNDFYGGKEYGPSFSVDDAPRLQVAAREVSKDPACPEEWKELDVLYAFIVNQNRDNPELDLFDSNEYDVSYIPDIYKPAVKFGDWLEEELVQAEGYIEFRDYYDTLDKIKFSSSDLSTFREVLEKYQYDHYYEFKYEDLGKVLESANIEKEQIENFMNLLQQNSNVDMTTHVNIDKVIESLEAYEWVDSADFDNYAYSMLFGGKNGIEQFGDDIKGWLSGGEHTATDYKNMYIATALSNYKGLNKTYNLSSAISHMLPSIIPGVAGRALTVLGNSLTSSSLFSSLSVLGKAIGTSNLFLSSSGASYKSAKLQGANDFQAFLKGMISGCSETSLEVLMGGIPFVSNAELTGIKGTCVSVLREVGEEVLQNVIDRGASDLLNIDPYSNHSIKEFALEDLETVFDTVIITAVLDAMFIPINMMIPSVDVRKVDLKYDENGNSTTLGNNTNIQEFLNPSTEQIFKDVEKNDTTTTNPSIDTNIKIDENVEFNNNIAAEESSNTQKSTPKIQPAVEFEVGDNSQVVEQENGNITQNVIPSIPFFKNSMNSKLKFSNSILKPSTFEINPEINAIVEDKLLGKEYISPQEKLSYVLNNIDNDISKVSTFETVANRSFLSPKEKEEISNLLQIANQMTQGNLNETLATIKNSIISCSFDNYTPEVFYDLASIDYDRLINYLNIDESFITVIPTVKGYSITRNLKATSRVLKALDQAKLRALKNNDLIAYRIAEGDKQYIKEGAIIGISNEKEAYCGAFGEGIVIDSDTIDGKIDGTIYHELGHMGIFRSLSYIKDNVPLKSVMDYFINLTLQYRTGNYSDSNGIRIFNDLGARVYNIKSQIDAYIEKELNLKKSEIYQKAEDDIARHRNEVTEYLAKTMADSDPEKGEYYPDALKVKWISKMSNLYDSELKSKYIEQLIYEEKNTIYERITRNGEYDLSGISGVSDILDALTHGNASDDNLITYFGHGATSYYNTIPVADRYYYAFHEIFADYSDIRLNGNIEALNALKLMLGENLVNVLEFNLSHLANIIAPDVMFNENLNITAEMKISEVLDNPSLEKTSELKPIGEKFTNATDFETTLELDALSNKPDTNKKDFPLNGGSYLENKELMESDIPGIVDSIIKKNSTATFPSSPVAPASNHQWQQADVSTILHEKLDSSHDINFADTISSQVHIVDPVNWKEITQNVGLSPSINSFTTEDSHLYISSTADLPAVLDQYCIQFNI